MTKPKNGNESEVPDIESKDGSAPIPPVAEKTDKVSELDNSNTVTKPESATSPDNQKVSDSEEGSASFVRDRINVQTLKEMSTTELLAYADKVGVVNSSSLRKQEIIFKILESQSEKRAEIFGEGVLERLPDGFGFLRSAWHQF